MSSKSILLLGGGGHCRSVIDVIEEEGSFNVAGIVDRQEKLGEKISGYEVIGSDDQLPELVREYGRCLVTVGQLKSASLKIKLYRLAEESDAEIPVLISPRAFVSKNAVIEKGTVVFHGAVVNSGAVIGQNCIVNSGAIVEHDAVIRDHVHIAPGAIVNGHCRIESGSLLGSGAVMVQQTSLGENVIIGAGSVVTKSISEPGVYAGVPAKKIS